jgi:hypothetical protein
MTNLQTPLNSADASRETLKSWICELTAFEPEQVESLLEQMEDHRIPAPHSNQN